jgi:hypothetical protein
MMRSDEELKRLALALFRGDIFTDRQVQNVVDMAAVFMPLALMSPEQAKELAEKKPALIFEYVSKAGPIAVNGMPIFSSFHYLNEEEYTKFAQFYNKIKDSANEAISPNFASGCMK